MEKNRKTPASFAEAFKSFLRRFGGAQNSQGRRAALSPGFVLALVAIFGLSLATFWHKLDGVETGKDYKVVYESAQDFPVSLHRGQVLRQDFKGITNGLEFISFKLLVPGGGSGTKLTAKLLAGETVVESWDLDLSSEAALGYYQLKLAWPLDNSEGKVYSLELASDADSAHAPAAFATAEAAYEKGLEVSTGLSLNGEPFAKEAPGEASQVAGETPGRPNLLMGFVYKPGLRAQAAVEKFLVLAFFLLLAFVFAHLSGWSLVRQFLVLWVFASALLASVWPPLTIKFGDEKEHFGRAFEISQGHMVSEYNAELDTWGRTLPFSKDLIAIVGKGGSEPRLGDEAAFVPFREKAVYAPVSYWPQALGIFIARLFTDSISSIANAGRFANWLCVTCLLLFAVKLLPRGKEFLALALLLPQNVYESVLLSPDGQVVALSALMIAMTLHLRHVQKTPLSKGQLAVLYALAVWLSLCKLVYLPLCLVYLLIPRERFKTGNGKLLHALVMAAVVLALNLGWLGASAMNVKRPGSDSGLQLAFVLGHPLNYLAVLAGTLADRWLFLLKGLLGSRFGDYNLPPEDLTTKLVVWLGGLALACLLVKGCLKHWEARWRERLCFGAMVFITAMLIALAEYLYWTALYAERIDGMYGRYFLYALLPLYFVVVGKTAGGGPEERLGLFTKSVAVLTNLVAGIILVFHL